MHEQNSKIVKKMDPSRIGIAALMVVAGIGVVIWNFTPNEYGIIRISLYLIALEAFLILGGAYAFFLGFKTEFCADCNKALEMESKLYLLKDEQKILDYLNNHDIKALQSATVVESNVPENMIQLTLNYCKGCKNVGYADIGKYDENGRSKNILKDHPIDRKYFE